MPSSTIKIYVLTLFPEMVQSYFREGIMQRAIQKKILSLECVQIRDFAFDIHRRVDDSPFGGGPGMIMKCEPLYLAWKSILDKNPNENFSTLLMSPRGRIMNQNFFQSCAKEILEAKKNLILVCGRYEGIDERFIELCVDEEVSLGSFVLSGGEIPAVALMDGVLRLVPGVLGNEESILEESFSYGENLEFPQYTRPQEFLGKKVPEVLLSGNHQKIHEWRRVESFRKTKEQKTLFAKEEENAKQ